MVVAMVDNGHGFLNPSTLGKTPPHNQRHKRSADKGTWGEEVGMTK